MTNTIEEIIQELDLKPHPEGGYFKETYRSIGEISAHDLDAKFKSNRNYSTCIYFLLTSENFSAFHRINQDEIWHFYNGSAIALHTISPEGYYKKYRIGIDLKKGELPQLIVPANHWFAAEVSEPGSFSLVGCTVSPGFSFEDFELADQQILIKSFPEHEALIRKFTRNQNDSTQ